MVKVNSPVCGLTLAVAAFLSAGAFTGDAPPKPAQPANGDIVLPSGRCFCKLPRHVRKPVAVMPRLTPVAEAEPNGTIPQANVIPLGSGAGQDLDLVVSGSITPSDDQDVFKVTLAKGDIIGFAVNSQFDSLGYIVNAGALILMDNDDVNGLPYIYPKINPMPLPLNPKLDLNSALTYLVPAPGDYYIVIASYQSLSGGSYQLQIALRRPYLETQDLFAKQYVFVDFDGATINPLELFGLGKTSADMSPMRSFLPAWGLTAADESAVIDKVMALLNQKFNPLRVPGLNGNRPVDNIPGHMDIQFLNSRDNADIFGQPFVTRLIIGGTVAETGVDTLGIAQSIDPGNFDTQETAIIQLDYASAPANTTDSVNDIQLAAGVTKVDAVARWIAFTAAHELGHLLGNYHTEVFSNLNMIMDTGGIGTAYDMGVGADNTLGTADDEAVPFAPDLFDTTEGIAMDRLNEASDLITAYALSTGKVPGGSSSIAALFRPDLVLNNLTVTVNPLIAGVAFTVSVRVGNAGSAPTGDFLVSLFLDQATLISTSNGAAASVQVAGPINPGEYKQVTLTAVYPHSGDFTLALLADSTNIISETNEMNNMIFKRVSVLAQGTDLVVTNVAVTQPNPGVTASFDVVIENRGMSAANPFQVGFYANLGGAPTSADVPTAGAAVNGLGPAAATTVHFDLPPQDAPRAGYAWFFADCTNAVFEDNETNNTARATWGVPNDPFTISSPLSASTTVGGVGEVLQFGIGVTDPTNDPISYLYDFGDGTIINGGSSLTHAYAAEGFYTVRVTVSDGPFHVQTFSMLVEIVSEVIDLGVVRLSVKRGHFKFKIPRPASFAARERLKSMVMEGNPGEKARYRNLRLNGTAVAKGQYSFLIEYQSQTTHKIRRVRYRYTVID